MTVTRKDFEEIAQKKGSAIVWDDEAKWNEPQDLIHIDMNMVEASIRMASERATRPGIKQRFENLLSSGTDAQKIDFVMGEGPYYFPEDLERMAQIFHESGGAVDEANGCRRFCENVEFERCRCRFKPIEQICQTIIRRVCEVICK